MKIAICDDQQEDIEYLKKLIFESDFCPAQVEFYEFFTGEKLLENFEKFDLIFLDIKLEGISGTKTAMSIRLRDSMVPIAFYTGYDIAASRIFKIEPISYLVKYASIQEHRKIIDKTLRAVCTKEDLPSLFVSYDGKMFILQLSEILYLSIHERGTAIWLTDERRLELFGEIKKNQEPLECTIKSGETLENYYEQLKDYGFIYAKKSYIINARFITGRLKDSVLLKGGYELTVARSKKKEFNDRLIEYWRKNMIGGE